MEFAGSSRKRYSKSQKRDARHRSSQKTRRSCSSKARKKKKSDRPRFMLFKQFKDAKTGKPVFKFSKPTAEEIKKILARAEMCKPRTWKYLRKQTCSTRGRRRANSVTEPPKSRSTRNRSRRRSTSNASPRSRSITRSSRRKSIHEGEADYCGQKQYMSNKSQSELRSEFDEEERLQESADMQEFDQVPGSDDVLQEDVLMQKDAELRRREAEQEDFMAQRDKYMDELEEEQKDVAHERERVTQMSLEVVSAREQMMEHLASEKEKIREMRSQGSAMPEEGRDELNALNRIAEDSPEVDQEPVVANGDELREEVGRPDDYGTSPVDMNDQADSPSRKYMADTAASGLGSLGQRPYDSPTGMERETQHNNERFSNAMGNEQSDAQPTYDGSPTDLARETQHTNERFGSGHLDQDYDVVAQLREKHQELSGINEKIDVEEDDLRKKREEYEALAIELQKEEDKLRLLKEAVEDKVRNLDAILDKEASHQPSRPSAPSGTYFQRASAAVPDASTLSPEERLRLRGAGGSADERTRYVE